MLLLHVIESFSRVAQIAQQVVATNADHACSLALNEQVMERPLRQLHDNAQFPVDDYDAVKRANEWMADFLDAVERLHFLFGADAFDVERIEIAVDDLDGFGEAAGGLAFPDFAESTAAQRLDQAISRDGLGVRLPNPTHGVLPN